MIDLLFGHLIVEPLDPRKIEQDFVSIEFQEEQYRKFIELYEEWFKKIDKNLLDYITDPRKAIDGYTREAFLNKDGTKQLIEMGNAFIESDYQEILKQQEYMRCAVLDMTDCFEILFPKIEIEICEDENLKAMHINKRTEFLNAQYDFLVNIYTLRQSYLHEKIYFNAMNYFLRERKFLKTDVISADQLDKTIFDRFAFKTDPYLQQIAEEYKVNFDEEE